jgi:hypothetical protein
MADMTMIMDWLIQDFLDLFAHDNRARVALWPDAKASGLRDDLKRLLAASAKTQQP